MQAEEHSAMRQIFTENYCDHPIVSERETSTGSTQSKRLGV